MDVLKHDIALQRIVWVGMGMFFGWLFSSVKDPLKAPVSVLYGALVVLIVAFFLSLTFRQLLRIKPTFRRPSREELGFLANPAKAFLFVLYTVAIGLIIGYVTGLLIRGSWS